MQQSLLTRAMSPLSWCSHGANIIAEAGRGYDHALSGYTGSFSVGPDTTESAVIRGLLTSMAGSRRGGWGKGCHWNSCRRSFL